MQDISVQFYHSRQPPEKHRSQSGRLCHTPVHHRPGLTVTRQFLKVTTISSGFLPGSVGFQSQVLQSADTNTERTKLRP